MEPVTSKLRRTRLFANLPEDGLAELISEPGVRRGDLAEIVEAHPGDLVVLLEGGLHMTAKDGAGEHLAILSVNETAPEPAILYTIPAGAELRLTRFSTYLVIDGARLDSVIASAQEARSLAGLDDRVRERVAALIRSGPFKQLTFEQVVRCAETMQSWTVSAGEDVIVEGQAGDFFYVLESGQAEVVRRGIPVARLATGASFGEEALLQEVSRNATVRMVTDGRLLRLGKTDFDLLLKPELVNEVSPDQTLRLIERGATEIIDCRTEVEWELWRLPRARLMPLDQLRERARGLDKARDYIVYCRTGRRAIAGAFLMRQLGLKARVLEGGIAGWPYAVEGAPLGG
ncbi:MAG: cyclic nucleotide-binding domain-containing protein [Hyphomicrobiaceae bacterium]|nr:cyclic nucleotide-binding domain-containing protein [Hyphomicrobiaceae bacterium]